MKPTDIGNPDYFHKVVDCQWACPAHTPVPEYIRLIAAGRYSDAYMINWESNVFPGHFGKNLRPSLRARLPARARRGRARRHLPAEARRGRLQGRHHRSTPAPAEADERQAHRLHRRGTRVPDGGARPCPARLRGHRVRRRQAGRRHDAHARSRNSVCRRPSSTRRSAISSISASISAAGEPSTASKRLLDAGL